MSEVIKMVSLSNVVVAPDFYPVGLDKHELSIFMAGGITGFADWQKEFISTFEKKHKEIKQRKKIVLFNPRRENFDTSNINESEIQIKWEAFYLKHCDMISMWFDDGSEQPICLYELGAWSMTDKPLFLGSKSTYKRLEDIRIQTQIKRPYVRISNDIESLVSDIIRSIYA